MGTNTNFDSAFQAAKLKWESIIKCDLSDRTSSSNGADWFSGQFSQPYTGPVDDVVIGFAMVYIDGTSGPINILGQAGARYHRAGYTSPLSGIMEFDEDDFAIMSQSK